MALIGLANPIVDTNASIVLQRITPQEDRSRVFAAVESALLTSMALGAIAMPVLMGVAGLQLTLVILAVPIAAIAIAAVPRLRHLDKTTLDEGPMVGLLDSTPIFQELERPLLETLSGQFTREVVAGGTVILRAGDSGEHFFIIESGSVQAIDPQGGLVNQMGPGDCFGEIALLKDVPRTLTVAAAQDTVLHMLKREDFLAATSRYSGFEERMDALASVRLRQF